MTRAIDSQIKREIIRLRKRGLSYNEIRKKFPVSKASLSLWLKSVPLSDEHKKRLYSKRILSLALGSQSQKERRIREINGIIDSAKKEIELPLSQESIKLFGAALYWAEGNKKKSFVFSNSDPEMILFMIKWIESIFGIMPSQLKAYLNIHSNQNDLSLKKFWSSLTNIPFENFNKTFIKPANRGYKKNNLYYGTIKIYVPKGTNLRHRIYGWIKSVLKNNDIETSSIQNKWECLRETPRPINLPKI
jgi:hypothetical protein